MFNDECRVCRWCARYARRLWRGRIELVPWSSGAEPPAFLKAYPWPRKDDGGQDIPYQPFFEVGDDLFYGEQAVVAIHERRFGRPGAWFARWVAVPGVKVLKKLAGIRNS